MVLGLVCHEVLLAAHPDHPPRLMFGHALQHSVSSMWHPRAKK